MNHKLYPLLNAIFLIITLLVNYLAASGILADKTVGEVSDLFPTLITPADYAFGIWGFIYLWLIAFVGYQWYILRKEDKYEVLRQTGWWFLLSNLFNAAWIMAWVNLQIGLSVVLMFALLYCLFKLVIRLKLEIWDAPLPVIAFVWWPVCWYIGWICLAAITNVAAFLVSIHWEGAFLSPLSWTIILILFATALYLFLTFKRNMREANLVGAWGIVAIALREGDNLPFLYWTALICAAILLLAAGWHGYRNRETSPFKKMGW